jgi:hypothetical protein
MSEERLKGVLLGLGTVLTLLVLSPFAYMVLTGLSQYPDFLRPERSLELTFDHYRTVLTTESLHFLAYLRNSLIVSAVSAAVSVSIAALAAYAITRLTLPGKTLFILILSVSLFLPSAWSILFKAMAGLVGSTPPGPDVALCRLDAAAVARILVSYCPGAQDLDRGPGGWLFQVPGTAPRYPAGGHAGSGLHSAAGVYLCL